MQQQKLRVPSLLALVLIVFGSFGAHVKQASADLTSLVGGETGPAVGAAISCNKDAIHSGLSNLFGKDKPTSSAGGKGGNTTETGQSVPVQDESVKKNTERAAEEAAKTTKKLTCTNAIARAVSQTILKELTVSTINWINSGFQGGGPLYIGDTETFLKNIGDQSVKQFASVIGFDPVNYPFGKMVVQGLIQATSTTFESAARYSLNNVISQRYPGMTSADFAADFTVGGWDAFLSQTEWQNNPIGFSQHASETLASRTADTNYSPAQDIRDQIQRNGGFLDLKKCLKPRDYDPNSTDSSKNACQQWMNQTPGSVVQSTLNKALGSPFDQLGLGQDLSTDLTAIFDALINHFVQKGLNALSEETSGGNNGTPIDFDGIGNNQSYATNTIKGGNYSGSNTSFLDAGDGFQTNIFDLHPSGKEATSATEDEEGNPVYRSNLVGIINRELQLIPSTDIEKSLTVPDLKFKTTAFGWDATQINTWKNVMGRRNPRYIDILDKQNEQTEKLIPALYQLDYCIPGPRPDWKNKVFEDLERELDGWPKDANKVDLWQANSKFQKIMDMSGNLNKFSQAISDITGDVREENFYGIMVSGALSNNSPEIKKTLGIDRLTINNTVPVAVNAKVNGYDKATGIIAELFSRYEKALTKEYSSVNIRKSGMDQSIITLNNTEYPNIATYEQSIIDNKDLIEKQKSMVYQLIALGKKIYRLQNNINLDPKSDGTFQGFPGTNTCIDEQGSTVECPDNTISGYDFYQSQINLVNQTSISKLTEYQKELRRINDTFNILAPDLHSDQDIKEQEALLDTVIDKVDSITGDGGYLDVCVDLVNDSETNATEEGGKKPYIADVNLMRLPYPSSLKSQIPESFKSQFKKPEGKSFLPDHYYRRGEDAGEVAYMRNLLGARYNPLKEIRNDDIVTINGQPIPNALATFEQFLGMY